MKQHDWTFIFAIMCLVGFVSCEGTEGLSDTDSETESDVDSDSDTGTECEQDTDTDEYEFKTLFECPTCVTAPADLVMYKDNCGELVTAFFDTVWSMAKVWLDESCVEQCDVTPPETVCLEADCVTDAGATVLYHYVKSVEGSLDTEEENLVIVPPVGAETWGDVSLQKVVHSVTGYYGGTGSGWDDYLATWSGMLRKDWPGDYQVTGYVSSMHYDNGDRCLIEWSHASCELEFRYERTYEFQHDYNVIVDDNWVDVIWNGDFPKTWKGFVNGESVGIVDQDTWEIIGE